MAYERGRYQDKWRIERQAAAVRGRLGIDQLQPLDPWRLADAVPAHVFYPEDLVDCDLAAQLRHVPWDGFAFCFPGESTLMVLLNSARPRTRQMATLMEELSHHLLGHPACRIEHDPATGLPCRSYTEADEHEAYDLGAAILLPKERIQRDVKAGQRAGEIASAHGCSEDLVVYRIRRMRLWRTYQRAAA